MSRELAVIMPVYNEEAAVGGVLDDWVRMLDALGVDYTIFPFNDGSRDTSLPVLLRKEEEYPGRIRVRNKANSGHGPTILQGYREACDEGYEWIFQVDSDGEMTPDSFAGLWSRREDYDFLAGIRKGRKQVFLRKAMSVFSRASVKLLFGKGGIYDVNVPYRLMRASAFAGIFRNIPDDAFAPNVLIAGAAAKKRLRCFEIPVPQHDRTTGEVSLKKWKALRAAVLSFTQLLEFALSQRGMFFWFIVCALIAAGMKFFMSCAGYNYDFQSYRIVVSIMEDAGNVYALTDRYNYAPGWMAILWALYSLFTASFFRYGLILLLSLADTGIALLLWKMRRRTASLIFLLSPVAWYISGYHNQFDNLAVLIAFCGVYMLTRVKYGPPDMPRTFVAALLFGLSLIVKHIFIFLPVWFLFRKMPLSHRLILFLLPPAMFFGSFLPYMARSVNAKKEFIAQDLSYAAEACLKSPRDLLNGKIRNEMMSRLDTHYGGTALRGMIRNVFLYRSHDNEILYRAYLPPVIPALIPPFLLFPGVMLLFGVLLRKRTLFMSFAFYTGAIVAFSTAVADQYLAIPLILASCLWMPWGLLYHIVIGCILIFQKTDYHQTAYLVAVFLLCCMLYQAYRTPAALKR